MQLLVSHGVAAAVAVAIGRSGQVLLALAAAMATGLVLTLTMQRTIWLVNVALVALNAGRLPDELPTRWHGSLGSLVDQVNALVTRQREVDELRRNLLRQASESAAQQERNRLARELHDSIKQQIFSISMGAAAVQARWEGDPPGARRALADVRQSAQEAMVEMNALLQQLSPTPLEKMGLRQALRDQCEAFGYRTGAEVTAEFAELPDDDRLPPGTQESLFRIAQEALSNVARHARADRVRLYLGQPDPDGPLVLEVKDNGQGFEAEAEHGGLGLHDGSAPHRGMGLDNIRQRTLVLGGELAIHSTPGKGAVLHVSVPLLEPQFSQKEQVATYPQDHTLNKAFLVGLGGGLALMIVLFYPLYVLLPGAYVAGWPAGSGIAGFVLQIVASLLPVVTGYLAARWTGASTRQEGTLLGALAGGVAGSSLYFGLGAAAAGVAGSAPLLEHGLVPAAGEAAFVRLVSEVVIGVAWWSHGAFWAVLLAGTGLSAIGGLLASPAVPSTGRSRLRPMATEILAAAAGASTLALVVAVAIFALLEPRIRAVLAEHVTSPGTTLPLAGLSLWPIGTALVFFLASLGSLCLLLRAEVRTEDPARVRVAQGKAAIFGLLCFGIPAWILVIGQDSVYHTPLLRAAAAVAILCCLVLGGLHAAIFVQALRRKRGLTLRPQHPVRTAAILGAILSLATIVWAATLPSLMTILLALTIILVDISLVVILRRQPKPPPPDVAGLARLHLSMSQTINAGLGSVVAMLVPLMTIIGASLSVITITIPSIPVLAQFAAAAPPYAANQTLIELVRGAYAAQARASLFAFVGAVAIVGLVLLLASARIAIARRQAARRSESAS
jgi:signal transduction histidine kinase